MVELSVAAVLVAVPLFVVPYSALPFEETKVSLLRTAALLALPFFALALTNRGLRPGGLFRFEWTPVSLLAALVLFFGYTHLVSSMFSVSWQDSIFGSLLRRQGTCTTLCYLFFFFATATFVRKRPRIDRVLLFVLPAGFVVSFWAVLQFLGLDPNLTHGFRKPTWSTLGNQLFLPAFLIMCLPVNIYFLSRAFHGCRLSGGARGSLGVNIRQWAFFLVTLLFLVLNLVAIAGARERGPLLGLATGLFLFLVLCLLGNACRKTTAGLLGGGGLLATLVMGVGVGGLRFEILARIPLVNALAESFQTGSGLVRFYIWKGVFDLLKAHPARLLFGYGAETLPFVLPVHNYAILKQIERPTAVADRAHNEILDLMVMQGIFGAAAFMAVFAVVAYLALQQMGLIASNRHRLAWVLSLAAGTVAGGLVPAVVSGETAWVGMGVGVGLVGGVFLYLLWYAMTGHRGEHAGGGRKDLLPGVLLTALTAHFVEIQFSFGITATRLYFWVFAGMIAALGMAGERKAAASGAPPQGERFTLPPSSYTAILAGLVIVVTSFGYFGFSRNQPGFLAGVLGCQLGVVLCCWLFFQSAPADGAEQPNCWGRRDMVYPLVVLAVGSMYYFSYFMLEGVVARALFSLTDNSVPLVLERNVNLTFFFIWMIVLILIGARLMPRRADCNPGAPAKGKSAWLYLFMVVLVLAPAIRFNLYYVMADIYTKAGDERSRSGEWQMSGQCYERAIALEPGKAWRHQKLGLLFFTRAAKEPEPRKRHLYAEALLAVEKAAQLSPLDVTLKNNLARMGSMWAGEAGEERTRFHRLKVTQAYYDRALGADPNNPLLWQEAGQISAALGSLNAAVQQFRRALYLKPGDVESHRNLALLYRALKQYPRALEHARAALALAKLEDRAELESLAAELEKIAR